MAILDVINNPAIRAALDTSITPEILPDAIIALPPYAPAAIDEVLLRDPLAAGRVGEEARLITAAAIFLCAASLALAVPLLSSEQMGQSYRYARTVVNPETLVTTLRARADSCLALVLTPGDQESDRPTMFTVGCGRRGQ